MVCMYFSFLFILDLEVIFIIQILITYVHIRTCFLVPEHIIIINLYNYTCAQADEAVHAAVYV